MGTVFRERVGPLREERDDASLLPSSFIGGPREVSREFLLGCLDF